MNFREPFLAFLRRSHLPCSAEFVLKVAEDFSQWVEDKVEAAHWAKLDMRQRADHLRNRWAVRRARDADSAVNDGVYLLESKKLNPQEWAAFLAESTLKKTRPGINHDEREPLPRVWNTPARSALSR